NELRRSSVPSSARRGPPGYLRYRVRTPGFGPGWTKGTQAGRAWSCGRICALPPAGPDEIVQRRSRTTAGILTRGVADRRGRECPRGHGRTLPPESVRRRGRRAPSREPLWGPVTPAI